MGRSSLHGFWDARDQRKRRIEKIRLEVQLSDSV